jgi:hypothetical protein
MSSRKIAVTCVALLGVSMLLGSEARAGGMRTTMGAQGAQTRGCRNLVTLKHPDAKGAEFNKEVGKCKADPDGYNK